MSVNCIEASHAIVVAMTTFFAATYPVAYMFLEDKIQSLLVYYSFIYGLLVFTTLVLQKVYDPICIILAITTAIHWLLFIARREELISKTFRGIKVNHILHILIVETYLSFILAHYITSP